MSEEDWVDLVKDYKPRSRKGVVQEKSPKSSEILSKLRRSSSKLKSKFILGSPKYHQIKFHLASSRRAIDGRKTVVDQTDGAVARRSYSSLVRVRVSQNDNFNLRKRATGVSPVPVQLLPRKVESRKPSSSPPSLLVLVPTRAAAARPSKSVQSHDPSRVRGTNFISRKCPKHVCVQCLKRIFEVKEDIGRREIVKGVESSTMSRVSESSEDRKNRSTNN